DQRIAARLDDIPREVGRAAAVGPDRRGRRRLRLVRRRRLLLGQALDLGILLGKARLVLLERRPIAVYVTDAILLVDQRRRQDACRAQVVGKFFKIIFESDGLAVPPAAFEVGLDQLQQNNGAARRSGGRDEPLDVHGRSLLPGLL